jgi:hypothetical protein
MNKIPKVVVGSLSSEVKTLGESLGEPSNNLSTYLSSPILIRIEILLQIIEDLT